MLPLFPAARKGSLKYASSKALSILAQNIPVSRGSSGNLDHRKRTNNKTTLTYEGAGDFEPRNRAGKNLSFRSRACDGGDGERAVATEAGALRVRYASACQLTPHASGRRSGFV